jgi:hypothetical protein
MYAATGFSRSQTNVFDPATEKYLMKKLIAALVAGMFAAATLNAIAADPVKSGGSTDKPGRAADEGSAVKSGGSTDKPGRTADADKKPTTTPATSTTSTTHKKKAKKPAAAPAAPKS